MQTIMAIDPGKTTGAIWWTPWDWVAYQWTPTAVRGHLEYMQPKFIVMESFLHRQAMKVDYTPAEVIGNVKDWASSNDVKVKMQSPTEPKHFWTNEKLKKVKLYTRGKPHSNDAMRHLLYYLVKHEGRKDLLELLV